MKYVIKTEGLHCGHCDASVESALLKVVGVVDADADHETQTVTVESDVDVDPQALADAVAEAGFTAVSVARA